MTQTDKIPEWWDTLAENRYLLDTDTAIRVASLDQEDLNEGPSLSLGEVIKEYHAMAVPLDLGHYVLVGLVDGQIMEKIARSLPDGVQITVIEPDLDRIRWALIQRVYQIPRGKVLIVSDKTAAASSFTHFLKWQPIAVAICKRQNMERLLDVYKYTLSATHWEQQTAASNWATIAAKSFEWSHNGMINLLRAAKQNWRRLENHKDMEDAPALVIAAGPSLDQSMDLIRQWPGPRFCVGHALRPVLNAGITPEYCVITEGLDSSPFLEGLDLSEITLITIYCVHPNVLANFSWKDRIVISGANVTESLAWVKAGGADNQRFFVGPSCACTAARVSWGMGCRIIALVGQDLAYSCQRYASGCELQESIRYEIDPPAEGQEENPYHGTVIHGSGYKEAGTLWQAKEGGDRLVVTTGSFISFISDFKNLARDGWEEGAFVDLSADGAKIPGWAWEGDNWEETLAGIREDSVVREYHTAPQVITRAREAVEEARAVAEAAWFALRRKTTYDFGSILQEPFLVGLTIREFDADPTVDTLKAKLLKARSLISKILKQN